MSDESQGPGWWLASDGKWYPPEAVPGDSEAGSTPTTARVPGVPYTNSEGSIVDPGV